MKQKHLLLFTAVVALCLALVAGGLVFSGFAHSHAVGAASAPASQQSRGAPKLSTASPLDIVQGNVYYGLDGRNSSAYALNAKTGVLLWQYQVSGGPFLSSLTLANGRIYFAAQFNSGNGTAYALKASTGTLLWSYQATGFRPWSPLLVNGIVYLTANNEVHALRASDGSQLWSFQANGTSNQPGPIEDGVVYFNAFNYPTTGTTYALKASDGTRLWQQTLPVGGPIVTVAHGVVYVITATVYPSVDGVVYALKSSDGSQLWNYTMPSTRYGNGQSSLTVVKNRVYVMADFGHGGFSISALNASSGSLVWPQQTLYVFVYTVQNGVLYLSNGNAVYAFDAANGTQLWSYQPSNSFAYILVNNNVVYVFPSGGPVTALNASNGNVLWNYQAQDVPAGFLTTIANGVLYAGGNTHMYAINASTGTQIWSHVIAQGIASAPTVANGIVYVTSAGKGIVHALNASTGKQLWQH